MEPTYFQPRRTSGIGSKPITTLRPNCWLGSGRRAAASHRSTGLRHVIRLCALDGSTGIANRSGEEAYTIRFTPRRKGSIWSKVNVERYGALTADGLMKPAGVRAYEENKAQERGLFIRKSARRVDAAGSCHVS